MADLIRVAVLMGGPSDEHLISLESGKGVLRELDRDKYLPLPVVIERDGTWRIDGGDPVPKEDAPRTLRELAVDAVFIAMHGAFGEDGTVQALLDWLDIPYIGSGVAASALAMNKATTKLVFAGAGVRTPASLAYAREDELPPAASRDEVLRAALGPAPYVVKPLESGSSVGIELLHDAGALWPAVERIVDQFGAVLVEEHIAGQEYTSAVLDVPHRGGPEALPVVEITPLGHEFFDLESKYDAAAHREICPAPIDDALRDEIQRIGLQCHRAIGCRGFSRTDVIVRDGVPYAIEINTIPGLTPESLFPQASKAHGISYRALLDLLLEACLQGH